MPKGPTFKEIANATIQQLQMITLMSMNRGETPNLENQIHAMQGAYCDQPQIFGHVLYHHFQNIKETLDSNVVNTLDSAITAYALSLNVEMSSQPSLEGVSAAALQDGRLKLDSRASSFSPPCTPAAQDLKTVPDLPAPGSAILFPSTLPDQQPSGTDAAGHTSSQSGAAAGVEQGAASQQNPWIWPGQWEQGSSSSAASPPGFDRLDPENAGTLPVMPTSQNSLGTYGYGSPELPFPVDALARMRIGGSGATSSSRSTGDVSSQPGYADVSPGAASNPSTARGSGHGDWGARAQQGRGQRGWGKGSDS